MGNSFSVQLTGAKELVQAIQKHTQQEARADLRVASRAAMKPVQDRARAAAKAFDDPDTPVAVWKNIATRAKWDRKEQAQITSVGVQGGARYRGGEPTQAAPFHWRFRELGTEHQPARPFLRPALENHAQEVLAELVSTLRVRLQKRQ